MAPKTESLNSPMIFLPKPPLDHNQTILVSQAAITKYHKLKIKKKRIRNLLRTNYLIVKIFEQVADIYGFYLELLIKARLLHVRIHQPPRLLHKGQLEAQQ